MVRGKDRLLRDQVEREVPALIPMEDVKLTPEEVEIYRQIKREHGDYAFAIDRQSDDKELRRPDATGQARRVAAIMAGTKAFGAWLPEPVFHERRQKGELPFTFDERFWFVDSGEKRASGYCASPCVRKRFMYAFELARTLTKHGCGPKVFVIGESTRLFRDKGWLITFLRALWDHNVEVFACDYTQVNDQTVAGFIATVQALNSWLPQVSAGARKTRWEEGRLFHNQPRFSLYFNALRDTVYAEPEEWPLLCDLVEHLADGRLRTLHDATVWLNGQLQLLSPRRADGKPRRRQLSQHWISTWLKSETPEGHYIGYPYHTLPRRVRQEGGVFSDYDVTERGYQRYLKVCNEDRLVFEIQFDRERTWPIPALHLSQARARVHDNRRPPHNPENVTWKDQVLLSPRLLKCAHCGYGVEERPPESRYVNGKPVNWGLRCRCVDNLRMKCRCTYAAARELPAAQHKKYAVGSASLAIWHELVKRAERAMLAPERPPQIDDSRDLELEAKLADLNVRFERFQWRTGEGLLGDARNPKVRTSIDSQRQHYLDEIEATERELWILATRRVTERQQNVSLRELFDAITRVRAHRCEFRNQEKREFLEKILEKVVVDLETGTYTVKVEASTTLIAGWVGRIVVGESCGPPSR